MSNSTVLQSQDQAVTTLVTGDWAMVRMGLHRGEIGQIEQVYALGSQSVAIIRVNDTTAIECYTAILKKIDEPRRYERTSGTFRLVRSACPQTNYPGLIEIDGDDYGYIFVHTGNNVAGTVRMYKLGDSKADPDGYTVTIMNDGRADCTCPHFIYRNLAEQGLDCKHAAAVRALNLIAIPDALSEDDLIAIANSQVPF